MSLLQQCKFKHVEAAMKSHADNANMEQLQQRNVELMQSHDDLQHKYNALMVVYEQSSSSSSRQQQLPKDMLEDPPLQLQQCKLCDKPKVPDALACEWSYGMCSECLDDPKSCLLYTSPSPRDRG